MEGFGNTARQLIAGQRSKVLFLILTIIILLVATYYYLGSREESLRTLVQGNYYFLDNVEAALLDSELESPARTAIWEVREERRYVLSQIAPSTITFENVAVESSPRLRFGIAINPRCWFKECDGATFRVTVENRADKLAKTLFELHIDPHKRPDQRGWQDVDVSLEEFERSSLDFAFSVLPGPKGDRRCDWGGWSEPRIEY